MRLKEKKKKKKGEIIYAAVFETDVYYLATAPVQWFTTLGSFFLWVSDCISEVGAALMFGTWYVNFYYRRKFNT